MSFKKNKKNHILALLAAFTLTAALSCPQEAQARAATSGEWYGCEEAGVFTLVCVGAFFPIIACSPEVQESNIEATDRALGDLSEQELRNERQFVALVRKARALPREQKLAFYFNLAGIQSQEEIAKFLGAREIEPKYISAIAQSTGLSERNSQLVANKLVAAIIGQRK